MNRQISFFPMLLGIALLAFLTIGLIACGTNQSGGQGSGATPVPTVGSTPTSPSSVERCGTIAVSPRNMPIDAGLAQEAGNCFLQAYQQCRPAVLIFHSNSLDTVAIRTLTIEKKASGCVISDDLQSSVVPRPPSHVKTYTCTGVASVAGQLHITGCGEDGTIVIPMSGV